MTPAIIAAQRAGIRFTVHEYEHDPAVASYGAEVAEKLGVEASRVFKTLVASVDGGPVAALVPVTHSLDLKALASAAGGKRALLVAVADAARMTGYVAGGISPLGQRRRLRTVIDASALQWDRVYVSGGRRGLEISLPPAELARVARAALALIAR